MPLTLPASFNPGDADPGHTYNKVRICKFGLDTEDQSNPSIFIKVVTGYDPGDESFVRGDGNPSYPRTYLIRDIPEGAPNLDANGDPIPGSETPANPQFSTVVVKMGDSAKTIYGKAGDELYQWLIDNEAEYVGATIDPSE